MMDKVEYSEISVEQTSWQASEKSLAAIRRQVFVDEQRVPEDQEQDLLDEQAVHWLAYSPDNSPIATARLVVNGETGKLGRMAVLDSHRRRGAGAALMRKVIRHAVDSGLQQLVLHAQLSVEDFYRRFGFVPRGDAFMEAGIAHIAMTLDLYRYDIHRGSSKSSEAARQPVPVDGPEDYALALKNLAAEADRTIRIYSDQLTPDIYSDKAACNQLYEFAVSHALAEIKVLVKELDAVKSTSVGLVELAQRLPSRVHIQQASDEIAFAGGDFAVQDYMGLVYRQDPQQPQGYYLAYAPQMAKSLVNQFEALWAYARPAPDLRRMSL